MLMWWDVVERRRRVRFEGVMRKDGRLSDEIK
jgi:hypothetical protein